MARACRVPLRVAIISFVRQSSIQVCARLFNVDNDESETFDLAVSQSALTSSLCDELARALVDMEPDAWTWTLQ